jgi:hypothetical protein
VNKAKKKGRDCYAPARWQQVQPQEISLLDNRTPHTPPSRREQPASERSSLLRLHPLKAISGQSYLLDQLTSWLLHKTIV